MRDGEEPVVVQVDGVEVHGAKFAWNLCQKVTTGRRKRSERRREEEEEEEGVRVRGGGEEEEEEEEKVDTNP